MKSTKEILGHATIFIVDGHIYFIVAGEIINIDDRDKELIPDNVINKGGASITSGNSSITIGGDCIGVINAGKSSWWDKRRF